MAHSDSKALRFFQIEALLLTHPEGLSQSDIARRLGVHRSTIMRNLVDIPAPVYEEHRLYFIDREAYLVNVRLNLHEALAIHLAGRLMAACIDRQNAHAASAFRKLGLALETLAPHISHFVCCSADMFDGVGKRQDPHYLQVLEKLTLCWAERKTARLYYRSAESSQVKEYAFCPYFVEVGAAGQSVYAIGSIQPENALRTFKVERVERIDLTNEPFCVPTDFDPERLFDQAWNIWYSDRPPVEIVLRFSPRVARRVGETRWHSSERTITLPDGALEWRAWIAEPREMIPWLRGWGVDCEVLEPAELRERVKQEVAEMAEMYGKK